VALFDLDVEEPNDNHFLKLDLLHYKNVNLQRPVIDKSMCNFCGLCGKLCEFNALAVLPNDVLVFDELCHSCGLCSIACPEKAIKEKPQNLGVIKKSKKINDGLIFYEGIMNVGEALATPIIKELKRIAFKEKYDYIILDLPPGSACPVVEALSNTDYAILVTEPTPAGEHDLEIAINLVKQLGIPFGIVNNRSDVGDDRITKLIEKESYKLILEIPHDDEILKLYSNGFPLIGTVTKYDSIFSTLHKQIMEII
jgi:MinD superfamily P-loop ATPase